jgi:hypothetical protein
LGRGPSLSFGFFNGLNEYEEGVVMCVSPIRTETTSP